MATHESPSPFLADGGEMGARMRAFDWSATPLGDAAGWPQALRQAVNLCLDAQYPICLYWGAELIMLYNEAFSPILGRKHPAALGRPGREVSRETWEFFGSRIEMVLAQGVGSWIENELLFTLRNGYIEECYFNYTLSPIRDERGVVLGTFNTAIETTYEVLSHRRIQLLREVGDAVARGRSAEEVCALAAAALRDNTAPVVPFVLLYLLEDHHGKHQARLVGSAGLVAGGPGAAEFIDLGAEPEAARAWPLADALDARCAMLVDDVDTRFGRPLVAGPWPEPVRCAVVAPLPPQSETPRGFLVAGVNQRRAFDEPYALFHDMLANTIAQAIANAEALQAEHRRAETLAELDRAKTAFFMNISHEFRTPLTLILGPLETLLARPEPPAATDLTTLELIQRNGFRLLKLVNTLLEFARLEAGQVQPVYRPVDLAGLTSSLASMFGPACEQAGLHLRIECSSLDKNVYVDPAMWEKIVLNLLSNAFKFTLQGTIAVRLRAADDGRNAVLTVTDTGIGIDEEQLPRIWQRFHRVEGAHGRSHEGSGVGLALVQDLVELHRGSVSAISEVGRGTTFTVAIPFGHEHLEPGTIGAPAGQIGVSDETQIFIQEALHWLPDNIVAEPAVIAPSNGVPAYPGSAHDAPANRPRLLLAEDNADMRRYLAGLLSPHYEVTEVADGAAALAAVHDAAPDIVLSDVMMPGINGVELLRRLRADPATSAIPVVLLSARAGEEARIEGLAANADDYVAKPFSMRELLARLRATTALARSRREAAEALLAAQEQTKHAQQMQVLGQLAAGVAHEFNNILQAVLGSLGLIESRPWDTPRVTKFARIAQVATARGSVITRRLLAFARRAEVRAEWIDPAATLEALRDVLDHTLGGQVAVSLDLRPDLPGLLADKGQLESALVNLVTNARDAMANGGTITFVAAPETVEAGKTHPANLKPGRYVRLEVHDRGIGMDRETLARATNPFFTTKPPGSGTGLGLSMVKGFAEQSGGELAIESELGRGTTVTLWLPAANAAGEPPAVRQQAREFMLPAKSGKRILLVDDEAMVRETLAAGLEEAGLAVLLAQSGSEALALLDAGEPVDALVADFSMPGMNGLALIHDARGRRSGLPSLLLTGYLEAAEADLKGSGGPFAVLRKPIGADQLAAGIEAMLAGVGA